MVSFVFLYIVAGGYNGALSSAEYEKLPYGHIQHFIKGNVHSFADIAARYQVHSAHIKICIAVIDNGGGVFSAVHTLKLGLGLYQKGYGNSLLAENADIFGEIHYAAACGKVVA